MSGTKRGSSSSSSSSSSLEYSQPNLKKQKRIEILSFSSTFTSSSSSVETSEINNGTEKRSNLVGSDIKAARVEMLKKRFSRIIVKATQSQDDGSIDLKSDDSVTIQMKKEILMEKKLKETQIVESKREIQRKREAARKALLELERIVEVNDNIKTMKDFAMLLGYPPQNCAANCVINEIGWYGSCFSTTSRTTMSDWRKR